jgi:hypothetical protein
MASRRPKTGLVKFAGDWTGVFIRGDDAKRLAYALDCDDPGVALLEEVLPLLRSSDERTHDESTEVQKLRPWHRCQPWPESVSFSLSPEEAQRATDWADEHLASCKFGKPENQGAIGGVLSYVFTDTSMGQIATLKCACGEKQALTNFDNW